MKNGKPPFISGWRSRSSDLLPLEPSRQVGEAVGVDCVVKSEMKKFPFIFVVIYILRAYHISPAQLERSVAPLSIINHR